MLQGAVIYAINLDRLTRFYTGLGGEVAEQSPGEYVVFGKGDTTLTLVQAPDHIASTTVIKTSPIARSATPIKPVVQVGSLDGALSSVEDHGGGLLPEAGRWRFRGAVLQDVIDPEGNVMQLSQREKDSGDG